MIDESSKNGDELTHRKKQNFTLRRAITIFIITVTMFSLYLAYQPFRYYHLETFLLLVLQFSIVVFSLLVIAYILTRNRR